MGCNASKANTEVVVPGLFKSQENLKQDTEQDKAGTKTSNPHISTSRSQTKGSKHDLIDVTSKDLTIIHFNDVYNIEPQDKEPAGGAARFVTKVKEFAKHDPLVLFSGDCLNPSISKLVLFNVSMRFRGFRQRWPFCAVLISL